MKRWVSCLLLLSILLSGCAGTPKTDQKRYNATFLTLFDTVTTIVGFAENEIVFRQTSQKIHDELLIYHQLFDIYNDYEGIVNLKTVNEKASQAPVVVDEKIMALLLDCKDAYDATDGKVNVAMGSVLALWHEARNDGFNDPANAYLPDEDKLEEAGQHTDFDSVILDFENNTVFFADPLVKLDVGAIAKGWSVQRVCENAPSGLLISVGGNVCATGPKDESGTAWVVGVQNPDGGDSYLHTLAIAKGSVVTSGDYQRAYAVNGELYHHIIDPNTLYPSRYWRSVTIVCQDSGIGDVLSTALFILPLEEGKRLLEAYGAEAMWVNAAGEKFYSSGFQSMIRT